ncbi:MAG: hypothetical protein AABZ55_00470 [Bdellovibrionota bacterium]
MDQADTLRKIMEDRRVEQDSTSRQTDDGKLSRSIKFQTDRDQIQISAKLENMGPMYRLLSRLAGLILGRNEVNR